MRSLLLFATATAASALNAERRQDGPVDPGINSDCTFWDTATDSHGCEYFEATWTISHKDFLAWNPAVKSDCSGIVVGHSYCVEVNYGVPVSTTKTPTTPTGTPLPSPTQDGLTKDCVRFYKAAKGDTCDKISRSYGTFTTTDFIKWNPALGDDCTGLWANTYYCVGVPSTPTGTPTTTSAPQETCNPTAPKPIQPGTVCGCTKWHFVKSEQTTCDAIIAYDNISADDFFKWNPKISRDCTNLWVGYNVCVDAPRSTPEKTTSTTSSSPQETCNPGAPHPIQPGAVCHCNKWHLVQSSSTTCDAIIKYDNISADDFFKWNPKIGRDCKNLWVGYNVCVGVPGSVPAKTTTAAPPRETCNPGAPQPVQPGAVCHCKKWHLVKNSSTTCDGIIKYDKISANDFYKWNPKIGRDCKNLWVGYNVCVGV